MKRIKLSFFYLICSINIPTLLFGADIGSDTAVTRFDALVTLNTGDRVAGFAALDGGFSVVSGPATWDSFFGVRGPISLNNNTLQLNQDLLIRDVSSFQSLGTIWGNHHTIEIPDSMSTIPVLAPLSTVVTFSNVMLQMEGDVSLQGSGIRFVGDNVLNGQGNVLTLSATTTLIVDTGSTLLIKDITIQNVSGTKIQNTDSTSTITFQNVELNLNGNYLFTAGHFDVQETLDVVGSGFAFAYQSTQTSSILTNAEIIMEYGTTFSYMPASSNRDLINLVDSTAIFMLNGATLASTTTGIRLERGRFLIDGKSFLSSSGFATGQRISFGDGVIPSNNLTVQWLPAATLEVLQGGVVDNSIE